MSRLLLAMMLFIMAMLSACTSLQPRPADTTVGCMQAVREQLPSDLPDKRLHCLASAQIARQCSVGEAYLAGMGKELSDLFGTGDADWEDWRADRAGVRCGRNSDAATMEACCTKQGY